MMKKGKKDKHNGREETKVGGDDGDFLFEEDGAEEGDDDLGLEGEEGERKGPFSKEFFLFVIVRTSERDGVEEFGHFELDAFSSLRDGKTSVSCHEIYCDVKEGIVFFWFLTIINQINRQGISIVFAIRTTGSVAAVAVLFMIIR